MSDVVARSEYLLGGRRVKLRDLIAHDLLQPDAELRFERPRRGLVHRARVLPTGAIELEDGRRFASPSRAAAAAADARAFDGWHAWALEATGQSLDSLRQELLDRVLEEAEDEPTSPSDDTSESSDLSKPRPRHEWLKEAKARAEKGAPVSLTVRELISFWGAQGRGHRVSTRIETELANHGLLTSPDFRRVTLDADVAVVAESSVDTPDASAITAAPLSGVEQELPDEMGAKADSAAVVVGLAVSNLPSASAGVVSVTPQSTMEQAATLMLLNDYSQLAVLAGPRNLRGAISWKSIAQARLVSPSATLEDATVRAFEVPAEQDLIDVLPTLTMHDFVFVRDSTNMISGIVTTTDVVEAYDQLARPFFLLGELDQLLRRVISQTYVFDDVKDLCGSGSGAATGFDDLTMGDYQRILENPARWAELGWPLDRASFIERLNELREVRNDVMHFNPDPVPEDASAKLRLLIRLLRMYG